MRIDLGPEGNFSLVSLHQAAERRASGRHRGKAQLHRQQPGGLIGAEGKLALQLQGEYAVGVRRHQEGRPEPDGERKMRAVHDRASGDRNLLPASGAQEGQHLPAGQPSGLRPAAPSAAEAVRPALGGQIGGACRIVLSADACSCYALTARPPSLHIVLIVPVSTK